MSADDAAGGGAAYEELALERFNQMAGAAVALVAAVPESDGTLEELGWVIGARILGPRIQSEALPGAIEELSNLFQGIGFSAGQVVKLGADQLTYRLKGCASYVGEVPNTGRSVCAFDVGVIRGALETALDRDVSVKETVCSGMGYDYCQFEVETGTHAKAR